MMRMAGALAGPHGWEIGVMAADLLVRNVRPLGGDLADIVILAGRIAGGPAPYGVPVLDGDGRIALPGLVEAHTHLDKSLLGLPWYRNEVGPRLIDKIENERKVRKSLPIDPRRQSELQARLSVSHGTTFIRSHVDVDTECGVSGIEGVMATREALADIVDIDLVAFPQSGMLVRPGTVELLEQALRLGAETVGGLDPCAIDRDPKGHVDTVFRLAEKFGRGVDIHLHEPGEMGAFSMELIIERTIALGMQGKVIVSHAFCLGMPDSTVVDPLIAALAEARIAIMTTASASRTVPPLKRLVQAGVVVCAGSDGIHDTWGPYGNADMLERAMFVGQRYNLRRDDEAGPGARCGYDWRRASVGTGRLWADPRVRRRSGAGGGRDRRRGGCTAAGTAHGGEARPRRGPRWRDLALMRGRRTKLSTGWVVGHRDGRHCLLRNGEVVFEGDRVVFVGHGFPGEVEERRDYGIALIAPGFVDLDALGDLDTTVLGFDNQPAWRKGRVWPRSYVERGPYEMCSPEELAFQKRYAFAQLLLNGITRALPIASLFYREWGETTAEFSAAATAAGELGLRCVSRPGRSQRRAWSWRTTNVSCRYSTRRGACVGWRRPLRSARHTKGRRKGWCARCWRPIASRPARRNCCGERLMPAARWMFRFGCIAASPGWKSTWCYNATA